MQLSKWPGMDYEQQSGMRIIMQTRSLHFPRSVSMLETLNMVFLEKLVSTLCIHVRVNSEFLVAGTINLFPPTRTCQEASCAHGYKTSRYYFDSQELTNERSYPVTVFTCNYGPLPGFAASLACPSMLPEVLFALVLTGLVTACHRQYYHNYVVHQDESTRTYYGGHSLQLIQINEHVYIECAPCEQFATMMATAWLVLYAFLLFG